MPLQGRKTSNSARERAAANSAAATPFQAPPRRRFVGRSTSSSSQAEDREFLPAALELLETPPSPVAVSFIWCICAIFAVALVWSCFGWLDIYAIAQGKIQVTGRSKVIQPLEAGKVVTVLVQNGTHVKEGDVLLELDPTESKADQEATARELEAAGAEASRRRAAIEAARRDPVPLVPIVFSPTISEPVRAREQSVLDADLAQLGASRESLKAQLAQHLATKQRYTDSIAERARLIALSKERADIRQKAEAKGAGSRALIIDALEQYETQLTTQIGEKGQLLETEAALEAARKKLAETSTQFIADQAQKLAEAERKRDRLSQELVKAQTKNERTRLTAPISGTVQQLAVTTVGQVVTSGQSLLTIVPSDAPLEIVALVLNKDIGFVNAGQPAVIKVEAFPFGRYGTIDGTVLDVSRDAVDMRDAPNLSDAAAAAKPQGTPAASRSGPELVFPATISLVHRSMPISGEAVGLLPGMTVTVEIKTGQRRVIDYILSPLREVVSQSAHER